MKPGEVEIISKYIAEMFYAGAPCRICGEAISKEEIAEAVFAGYSKVGNSRSAHGKCWTEIGNDRSRWALPEDEKIGD